MALTKVQKALIGYLKTLCADAVEAMGATVLLYEEDMQLDMLEWLVAHEDASRAQRLEAMKRIASKYEREEA